jgi:decaprenylphospho-beta-D-ribofuranose 2-oxidase
LKVLKASGWGRTQNLITKQYSTGDLFNTEDSILPVGNHQSYGDSSLNQQTIKVSRNKDPLILDIESGILCAQACYSIAEILNFTHPYFWTIPSVPGTPWATIGGAIASNVHGKNYHHEGSILDHLVELTIMVNSETTLIASRELNSDLFFATCGGMGLTGIITSAKIQLKKIPSRNLRGKLIQHNNLDQLVDFLKNNRCDFQNTWIHSTDFGTPQLRSITFSYSFAETSSRHVPIKLKNVTQMKLNIWNNITIRAFNFLYSRLVRFCFKESIDLNQVYFPLNKALSFNQTFGNEGLVQAHIIIPFECYSECLRKIFQTIKQNKIYPVLASMKIFSKDSQAHLSFPIEGVSLAMDFAATNESRQLITKIYQHTAEAQGRVYLTKDAVLTEDLFKKMYPKWNNFQEIRDKYKSNLKLSSLQSRRIGLN